MAKLRNLPSEGQIQADIIQTLRDGGGEVPRTEVINALAKKWRLTPNELSYCTPGGYVYYQHRIDGAAHKLRSARKITTPERGIWQLASTPIVTELAKEKEEETPRLTHDELVQKVKEMGERLGKIAEVK